jgi:2'-5' RNA ligase
MTTKSRDHVNASLKCGNAQRLFFALWPTARQRAELVDAFGAAVDAAVAADARAIPVENWHVTLCFLGEQAAEVLPTVCAAAASIRAAPVVVTLAQLENWADSAVLCATPSASAPCVAVTELATQLAHALDAARISHDVNPFRAHLTLARKVRAMPRARFVPLELEFDRFALIESRPGPDGSIYSVVDSWHLYIE